MPDYALMYQKLFRSVTKVIEILQEAQQETEGIYISADEPIITLLSRESGGKNVDGDHT